MRFTILSILFVGCSNPFSNNKNSEIEGVWSALDSTANMQSIAFLDQGRYYENNTHVGAYTLLDVTEHPVGALNTVFTNYTVRIDYIAGDRVNILIQIDPGNSLEFNVTGISGRRGPFGNYEKIHTGEGL